MFIIPRSVPRVSRQAASTFWKLEDPCKGFYALRQTAGMSRHLEPEFISQKDFRQKLTRYFSFYAKMRTGDGEFDWDCIRHSLGYFLPYLCLPKLADVYMEVVFSLFEDFHCTNGAMVEHWLKQYIVFRLKSYGYRPVTSFVPKSSLDFSINCSYLCCIYSGRYNNFLKDYHGPLRDISIPAQEAHIFNFTLDTILKPFLFQDLKATRRMLRYGLPLDIRHIELHFFHACEVRYNLTHEPPPQIARGCRYEIENNKRKKRLFIKNAANSAKLRRLHILLLAIEVVVRKRNKDKYYQNCIESFKLLFETIEDPFITLPEVKRFLRSELMWADNRDQLIDDVCEEFAEEFPRCVEPLQPRKLQHLCRVQVRVSLRQAKTLPHGVWALKMPKLLKNYILLQKEVYEFHPKYGCTASSADLGYHRS